MKTFNLSSRVTHDEIFLFRKQILPQKEPSPMLVNKLTAGGGAGQRQNEDEEEEEEDMDAADFIPGLSGGLKGFMDSESSA